ncbi:MAG: metallophosphoesterase [Labilithrix sp.]|nr:metallophosphoesterase [Labilithrix sp.]MCW5814264.1 metallophosphoesterase [Labilithrix sp.]
MVALGDLHGDLDAARRALRLAGAIDDKDKWIGGKLVVVQTGDLVDRGDDDRTILDLVERLKGEAKAAGGEFVALNGNHEIMNAQLDFRYVTPGGFSAFNDVSSKSDEVAEAASKVEPSQRGRAAAFLPGGVYAKLLAERPLMARVGDSLFVHGGILPKHVRAGLDRVNTETREWLKGERRKPPKEIEAVDGPLWTRMYSEAPGAQECATLAETLKLLNAKRLVMGHTPQKPDIAPCCDGQGWRIDTGMSKYYQGNVEVLEIRGDAVKVLKEK